MKQINKLSLSFVAMLVALYGGVAEAQTTQRSLEITNPALLEQKIEEKSNLPQSELPGSKVSRPFPKMSEKMVGVKFQVERVEFVDGTVFSNAQLQEMAKPYIKKEITLKDLYALASEVSKLYQNKGYILSRAVVPPQQIGKGGVAKIQLIEGYVDSIHYEGEVSRISERAKRYAEKIKNSIPLNTRDLERYLLLMKDLPGFEVETVLKPSSSHSKASQLVIIAKRKILEGSVGINNYGSRYVGPYMVHGMVGSNSIMGIDDKLSVHAALTEKTGQMRHGMFSYDQFVGSEGTKVGVNGSLTQTRPGDTLSLLHIKGNTKALGFSLSHPVLRSRSQSFYVGTTFAMRNVKSGVLGNAVVSKDKLRVVGFNFAWDVADKLSGINLLNMELTQGIAGLGASSNNNPHKSRVKGRYDFTKLNIDFSRLQALWGKFSLFGIVNYQLAFQPLVSAERFNYGGSSHFRGYTDAPIAGDTGIKEKIELRYGEDRSLVAKNPFLSFYQLYCFYGFGTAWNKKPSNDERKQTSAPEVGGGIRLAFFKNTSFNLEAVKPLRRKVAGVKNPGSVFFSLTQKF